MTLYLKKTLKNDTANVRVHILACHKEKGWASHPCPWQFFPHSIRLLVVLGLMKTTITLIDWWQDYYVIIYAASPSTRSNLLEEIFCNCIIFWKNKHKTIKTWIHKIYLLNFQNVSEVFFDSLWGGEADKKCKPTTVRHRRVTKKYS